jgi:tetratricopeptide (TPR) repeat protein
VTEPSAGTRPADSGDASRRFWFALAGICLVGCLLRVLILSEYVAENPFSEALRVDALTYWDWAGRIAAGQLREPTPFFSAPLYPYLVGLIRACGGGMPAVYSVQIAMDMLTAVLLGCIGRWRFGSTVGLLAATIFLLALDSASFSLRILTSSLQFSLICLAWIALLGVQERPTWLRCCLVGLCTGLLSLSYPPAMLLVPLAGVWLLWNSRRTLADLGRAAVPVLVGAAVISPATIHNYLASGEFFAIQSAVGINFRQGNGPGATGTLTLIPGTSMDRELLFPTVRSAFYQETGRRGSWAEINRYYRNQALRWWLSDPVRTLKLFARKAYWFLTGRNFADIYNPEWEIDQRLTGRLRLAPIRTPWLIPPALVAVVAWLRRPRKYLPELAFFGIPLLVVIVFWFSPRYRSPALPVLVMGAAWALRQASHWRSQTRWTVAVAVSLVVAFGLGQVNRATGFDSLEPFRAQLLQSLGVAYSETGQPDKAIRQFEKALQEEPNLALTHAALGGALQQQGRMNEAIDHLRRAVAIRPDNPSFRDNLGNALAHLGRLEEAVAHFAAAVHLGPGVALYRSNLANALFQSGRLNDALQQYNAALDLDPTSALTHMNLGALYQKMDREDDALRQFSLAVRYNPRLAAAHHRMGQILIGRGQAGAGLGALREAHRLQPANPQYANSLAWHLATLADPQSRDPKSALTLARRLNERAGARDPQILDTLAAAQAADGQFAEAVKTAETALQLATRQQREQLAEQIRSRLERYRDGRPYIESPGD